MPSPFPVELPSIRSESFLTSSTAAAHLMDGDMAPTQDSSHGGNSVEQDGCGSASPPSPPSSDEAATCYLCGKTFPSRKAMYGHMRCHPERERKGGRATQVVSPPDQKPCGQLLDCSSSLASPLPGWSKTRKRGSKGVATATAAVDREARAVENGAPGGAPEGAETKEVGKREAASEDPDSEVSTTNAGSHDADSESPHCEGKGHGFGTAQACNGDCCGKLRSSSFQKKRRAEDVAEAAGSRSYVCDACGKTFSSFQGLGGHMANHGRHTEKGSNVGRGGGRGRGRGRGRVGSAVAAGGSKPTQRRRLEPTNEEHRCNVCGKVYPTGQALGGHKRLHWEGPKRPPPPGAGAAAPSPRELQRTSSTPRVRDFDLNQLPEEEDYDGRMYGWV